MLPSCCVFGVALAVDIYISFLGARLHVLLASPAAFLLCPRCGLFSYTVLPERAHHQTRAPSAKLAMARCRATDNALRQRRGPGLQTLAKLAGRNAEPAQGTMELLSHRPSSPQPQRRAQLAAAALRSELRVARSFVSAHASSRDGAKHKASPIIVAPYIHNEVETACAQATVATRHDRPHQPLRERPGRRVRSVTASSTPW